MPRRGAWVEYSHICIHGMFGVSTYVLDIRFSTSDDYISSYVTSSDATAVYKQAAGLPTPRYKGIPERTVSSRINSKNHTGQ